jgi:hypothetical protein
LSKFKGTAYSLTTKNKINFVPAYAQLLQQTLKACNDKNLRRPLQRRLHKRQCLFQQGAVKLLILGFFPEQWVRNKNIC